MLKKLVRRVRRRIQLRALSAAQRAMLEEWERNFTLTREEVDEIERRSIEGREDEIRQALVEADWLRSYACRAKERERQRKYIKVPHG